MIGHGQVAHAHPDAFVKPANQVVDAGEDATVPGPDIEIEHGVDACRHGARFDIVGSHQKTVIPVYPVQVGVARMHHQRTHHAHRHLHHLVRVGVVHEGAGLLQLELVGKGLAGRNLRLIQPAHAIHAGW